MAENQRLRLDYARPSLTGTTSRITTHAVDGNNFEIKLNLIETLHNIAQFEGMQYKDPNVHIANFLEI